jgi:hypothetical protein
MKHDLYNNIVCTGILIELVNGFLVGALLLYGYLRGYWH